ncbi:MAG TPA: SPOR domain-containing protein [Gemmatimonadaceae bacterium]|nr:SPOR domain-containing protein [Gemmatimonadaceae bacterium]
MRTKLLVMALVLVACGHRESAGSSASDSPVSIGAPSGADQLALRIPRAGGAVRAFAYPDLDSLIWTSSAPAPATERVLGFDGEGATLAALDTRDAPYRVDLRLGTVSRDGPAHLTHVTSGDGRAVFGVTNAGHVLRLLPEEQWSFVPKRAPRAIFPEPDGALLVAVDHGNSTVVWKIRPPDSLVTDSTVLPRPARMTGTPMGDRIYFASAAQITSLRTRDLQTERDIDAGHPVHAIVTTPSGDRIYIATDSASELLVVDRYTGEVTTRITLPAQAAELRMDPSGHYLFARGAESDSAWVIDIGGDRLVATVATAWRPDLPAVAPDGTLALLRGRDVVFVRPPAPAPVRTVRGGAADLWTFVAWNGFRPRAAGLDQPVTFDGVQVAPDSLSGDSLAPFDTTRPAPLDSTSTLPPRDSLSAAAPGGSFYVQFAALRAADAARQTAAAIHVDGAQVRVVSNAVAGLPIYRVVAGPFPSREAADRAARTANHTYWIYQGAP